MSHTITLTNLQRTFILFSLTLNILRPTFVNILDNPKFYLSLLKIKIKANENN
jgi:hypothetical protein